LHPGYNRVQVVGAPGGCVMDIIMGLVRAGVTLAVIVVIVGNQYASSHWVLQGPTECPEARLQLGLIA